MTRRKLTPDHPGRRATDQEGAWAKARYFWQVWGRDIWLVITTIVAMWAAILGYQANGDAKDAINDAKRANSGLAKTAAKAARQAQAQCVRSKDLTPPFIKILEDAQARSVVTADDVQLYKDIVPKRC